ncbi:hypothetical protein [Caldivirga sp. UBA161]|uniref:hypothetical protein n=1 Tax=Caldivirga sp. UBA161 TaxID=1915569 RepID=UPI0025C1C48B|nr:hypothetical protein [Caldivirga sp. UBA161]
MKWRYLALTVAVAVLVVSVIVVHSATQQSVVSSDPSVNYTIAVNSSLTCTAARVNIIMAQELYIKVLTIANTTGGYSIINADLLAAFQLLSKANETLNLGECAESLNYTRQAVGYEAEAYVTLMSRLSNEGAVNYTCLSIIDLIKAKINAAVELSLRLNNTTAYDEAQSLLKFLNSSNLTCIELNHVMDEASALLISLKHEEEAELANSLYIRVKALAITYIKGSEYGRLAQLASMPNSSYCSYIREALANALNQYADEVNQTMSELLVKGNLIGVLSMNNTISKLGEVLSIFKAHKLYCVNASYVYLNGTVTVAKVNAIYRELGYNATALSLVGRVASQVKLSYLNGTLDLLISNIYAKYNVSNTLNMIKYINHTINNYVEKGMLKWSNNGYIVGIPMPKNIARLLNLTWSNFTSSIYELNQCRSIYALINNTTINIIRVKGLNNTLLLDLALKLYLMRVYCPMAFMHAKLAEQSLNYFITYFNNSTGVNQSWPP